MLAAEEVGGLDGEASEDHVGQAPLGTGMTGYSIGTAFQTYHFQVDATGRNPASNAVSNHTQSFYVVGPGT